MIVEIGRANRRNNNVIALQLRVIQTRTVAQETTDTQPTAFGFAFRVASPQARVVLWPWGRRHGRAAAVLAVRKELTEGLEQLPAAAQAKS